MVHMVDNNHTEIELRVACNFCFGVDHGLESSHPVVGFYVEVNAR